MASSHEKALNGAGGKKKPQRQIWRTKDFHKDTRDSFMKRLDNHRIENRNLN